MVEDGLSFEHTVEITDAGVVTADDHLGASVVLAEGSVKQAFARTGIPHIQRVTALDDVLFHKVIFDQ